MKENEILEIQKGAAAQGYAISVEHSIRNILGCNRFGFGGLVDSDVIRKNPLATISAGLGYLFANANNDKRTRIEEYLENYSYYLEMPMDELLSFDSPTKRIDTWIQEIDYNNGKEAIEDYIDKLDNLIREQ